MSEVDSAQRTKILQTCPRSWLQYKVVDCVISSKNLRVKLVMNVLIISLNLFPSVYLVIVVVFVMQLPVIKQTTILVMLNYLNAITV